MRRGSGRHGNQSPLLTLRGRERGIGMYCGAARRGVLPRGEGCAKVRATEGQVSRSRSLPGARPGEETATAGGGEPERWEAGKATNWRGGNGRLRMEGTAGG